MEKGDRIVNIKYPATTSVLNFFRGMFGLPKLFQVTASYPSSLAKTLKDNHGVNLRMEVKIGLKEEYIKIQKKNKGPTLCCWDEIKRH